MKTNRLTSILVASLASVTPRNQQRFVYRALASSLAAGVAIATVWTLQISAASQAPAGGSAANAGTQIVGTWFGEGLLPVPGAIGFPVMEQFHADGTYIHLDASDYGGTPFTRKNGPLLGTWRRLGDRSFAVTGMFMSFNNSSNVITAISVFHATAEIEAGDFDHLTMTGSYVDYACTSAAAFPFFSCPDPLSPSATPSTPPVNTTIKCTRMRP